MAEVEQHPDRRHAPATARNREFLAEAIADELPDTGLVLEVASGTGEHAVYLARQFPALDWQPSDPDPVARRSIAAWQAGEDDLPNLRPPVAIDASRSEWPIVGADAILCVNMVHISPWEASVGLFTSAAKILGKGAALMLYGPYLEGDVETAPSNLAFDQSLRGRDPRWGLRKLADMDAVAAKTGFFRARRVDVPANNLVLVYRRL